MWSYYLRLGFANLRRNPVLTVLMVLTLAVGVAASMTTLTLLHGMSADPIPHKSARLFVPLLDNYSEEVGEDAVDPPPQLAWRDAEALWQQAKGLRQTPLFGISPAVDSGRADLPPYFASGVAVGRDFFAMFDAPWAAGAAWSVEEEQRAAQVVVIGHAMAVRLFETPAAAIGRPIKLSGKEFTVIGVLAEWTPTPKFYRLVGGARFDQSEDVFMPIRTALPGDFDFDGNINCSSNPPAPGFAGLLASECNMIQYWVELDGTTSRSAYADYLDAYVQEQKALGRFPRPLNNRLHDVRAWLDVQGVVEDDTRTAAWLSFGFLLVCLVNTVGLLLAKFSARPGEIGVRRALGAPRGQIFRQYLVEAGVIGLVGAAAGILLTTASLAFIRSFNPRMQLIASLDWAMLGAALVLAVSAALIAGLLPTWRACQVRPAMQLKSQ